MRHEPMSPTTVDLFADAEPEQQPRREQIGEQSCVLRGFALPWLDQLLPELEAVLTAAPLRQMVTPGGFTMSAAMSSCGTWGWTTDRSQEDTLHDNANVAVIDGGEGQSDVSGAGWRRDEGSTRFNIRCVCKVLVTVFWQCVYI